MDPMGPRNLLIERHLFPTRKAFGAPPTFGGLNQQKPRCLRMTRKGDISTIYIYIEYIYIYIMYVYI